MADLLGRDRTLWRNDFGKWRRRLQLAGRPDQLATTVCRAMLMINQLRADVV